MADNVRSPVVEVSFPVNTTVITYKGQYQYDHGLKLKIKGITSKTQPTVHYSYPELATVVAVMPTRDDDGSILASIPDIVLMQPKEVRCYVYVESVTAGVTTFEIRLPLYPRAKPASITQTPSQNESYDALTKQLNDLIKKAQDATSAATTATSKANTATSEANTARDAANAAAKKATDAATKLSHVGLEVEQLPANAKPTGSVKQTTDTTTFHLGIPTSNLAYATFEIHTDDASLYMVTPDNYDSTVTFSVNGNGELVVTV